MAVARTPQNPASRVQDSPLLRRGKVAKPGEGISVWWIGDELKCGIQAAPGEGGLE
jgi:hypothetical protein